MTFLFWAGVCVATFWLLGTILFFGICVCANGGREKHKEMFWKWGPVIGTLSWLVGGLIASLGWPFILLFSSDEEK